MADSEEDDGKNNKEMKMKRKKTTKNMELQNRSGFPVRTGFLFLVTFSWSDK